MHKQQKSHLLPLFYSLSKTVQTNLHIVHGCVVCTNDFFKIMSSLQCKRPALLSKNNSDREITAGDKMQLHLLGLQKKKK